MKNAKIDVLFRANELAEPICLSVSVNQRVFDLQPLPQDHDLPLIRDRRTEQMIYEKRRTRHRIAQDIARQLAPVIADAVVEAIGQQDPVNGYLSDQISRTTS